VHDSGVVRLFECVADLNAVLEKLLLRQRTTEQAIRQSLSFEILHNEVSDSVLRPDIV